MEDEGFPLHSGTSIELPSRDFGAAPPRRGGVDRSFWVAVAFTLNFIVGSGVLSLPHAVAGAGFGLSLIFLFIVYFVANVTAGWMVEITGRATLLAETDRAADDLTIEEATEPLMKRTDQTINDSLSSFGPKAVVTKRKWEMSELVNYFFGPKGRMAFDLCVLLFVFATLWLYTSVFCNTLAGVVFPNWNHCGEQWHYQIFVPVFAVIVIPLALMDLSGQVAIQLSLTAFAICIMLMMVFTTLGSMFTFPDDTKGCPAVLPTEKPFIQENAVHNAFVVSGFGPLFTTALFSLLCQHGAPSLMQLVEDKTKAKKVFFTAFTILLIIYSALSVFTTLYFCNVPSIITAAWSDYASIRNEQNPPKWGRAIGYIVQIFPIFTVSTAFPLSAVTLANTLAASAPQGVKDRLSARMLKLVTTAITVIPPLVAGAFVSDVSEIVQFPGLLGFFIMMFVPALLQFKSYRDVKNRFNSASVARTPYWNFLSNYFWMGLIFLAACAGFPFALYQSISTTIHPLPSASNSTVCPTNATSSAVPQMFMFPVY